MLTPKSPPITPDSKIAIIFVKNRLVTEKLPDTTAQAINIIIKTKLIPTPINNPFSLNILAKIKLSKKLANVKIPVVIGINIYCGVSNLKIIKLKTHSKNPKLIKANINPIIILIISF